MIRISDGLIVADDLAPLRGGDPVTETLRVALSGLGANRLRSGLTILGLMIGVGSVIVLVAVGTGSSAAVESQIEALGSNVLLVSATPGAGWVRRRRADEQPVADRGRRRQRSTTG